MSSEQMKNDGIGVAESQKARVSSARHAADVSAAPVEADSRLRIAALAEECSADQIWDNARSAAERIAEGRFYLACVGPVQTRQVHSAECLDRRVHLAQRIAPTCVRKGKVRQIINTARVRREHPEDLAACCT